MEPTGRQRSRKSSSRNRSSAASRARALGVDGDDIAPGDVVAAAQARPHVRSLRAWLATVVRRRASSVRRRGAAHQRRHEARASRADAAPDVADVVAREDVRRTLVGELLALDAADRDLLLMRYYEDLPPHAIAARLGIPPETARPACAARSSASAAD